ncbi:DUF2189 domain-containing protein [Phenylobacterium sp.]|uniref:DUF2189 domain-containing protein n=1 Tax=Phenylobacterium sp. TaxID=1871053 RepID=UPI002CB2484C|nr:DUF2189 domain-containing protein [Phenylobacterium sp.]HVI32991.1 DUF2189 domain-containing protein [Phenylobacterium sp.]
MATQGGLPAINDIRVLDPFRWLGGAWLDLWRAPLPLLTYGLLVAAGSAALAYGIYVTNAAFWVLALTFGFVFVAPVLAMGPYEAGRRLEMGERPKLADILLVRTALRQDVAYLGLALLLIYFFWGRIAQVVYGLSTYRLYHTAPEFVDFALRTPEGHNMLMAGSVVGGALAFFTFTMVVVSAPMLLDPAANMFAATASSFRAVSRNPGPMLLWAVLIALLVGICVATGFLGMILIFPWLGLASWRAYRALVAEAPAPRVVQRPPLKPVATR